jgi:hypothetical protein
MKAFELHWADKVGLMPVTITIASEGVQYRLTPEVSEHWINLPTGQATSDTSLPIVVVDSVEAIPALVLKARKEHLLALGWSGLWYRSRFLKILKRMSQALLGSVIDLFHLAA